MKGLNHFFRKRFILVFLCIAGGMGSQYLFSQAADIKINLYRPRKPFSNHIKFEVYFNERSVGTLSNDSKIECNLYSRGKIDIQLLGYSGGTRSTDLDIFRRIYTSPGEVRYFRLIQEEIWMLKDAEAYAAGQEFSAVKNSGHFLEEPEFPLIPVEETVSPLVHGAQKNKNDLTGPEISLLHPAAIPGQSIRINENRMIIKGTANDPGGIFEVQVNGNIATVDADGNFSYPILLAFGNNDVIITAKDVSLNASSFHFTIHRTSEPGITQTGSGKPVIIWQKPEQEFTSVTDPDLEIRACIQSGSQIHGYRIYLNNRLIFQTEEPVVQFRSQDCDLVVQKEIPLSGERNTLSLEILTESGNEREDRIIEFVRLSGEYYGLIIGIEDYDDPEIPDLAKPIDDAQRLYNLLVNKYTFSDQRMIFLKNPSKEEIIGTLHRLRTVLDDSDNLLIYYAGHGYWDEGMNTGYWLPRDSRRDNPTNWLPNPVLTSYIQAIKTKHTLLIADACFSGGIFRTRAAFSDAPASIEKLYNLPSRKAMTSGTMKEVPDESVFLNYLIKRLETNPGKYLSSEQLFSSLRTAVINNSPNIPQYGEIKNTGDEGGDFIFIRK
jgi:hypothetical protein